MACQGRAGSAYPLASQPITWKWCRVSCPTGCGEGIQRIFDRPWMIVRENACTAPAHCGVLRNRSFFSALHDGWRTLTPYAAEFRYPGSRVEPLEAEAQTAYQYAIDILQFVPVRARRALQRCIAAILKLATAGSISPSHDRGTPFASTAPDIRRLIAGNVGREAEVSRTRKWSIRAVLLHRRDADP